MFNRIQATGVMRMFNFLNVDILVDCLHENVVFTSDWVLAPIYGKEDLVDYLENKLATMKDCVKAGDCGYYSRLVKSAHYPDEIFVWLGYRVGQETGEIYIQTVTCEETRLIQAIRFLDGLDDVEFI